MGLSEDTSSVLGHRVQRREDPALLRGESRFVADIEVGRALHAHFVRSPAAHATIGSVRTEAAASEPGVVAVFVADDLGLHGLGEYPPVPGADRAYLRRPCLAVDRVRFVGEPVALVVAASLAQAVDAAELVELDLSELPAVVGPLSALDPSAELLFPEHGSNVVIDVGGNGADPLAGADVVVRERFHNQRVAPVPLEGGAILAVPGDRADTLTVWVSTQSPFRIHAALCEQFGLGPGQVRVVAPSVGGGFGAKGGVYPEHLVVAAAALRLRRPVRWVESRSENLVAMTHGRGQIQEVELGARRDGSLVGLRARTVTDVGAYPWRGGIATHTSRLMSSGVYRIPSIDLRTMAVVTTTTPVGPYRGAGRPEATAMLERAMDLLAGELGIDPVDVRRRNLLRPDDFPYTTPTGAVYDSGRYEAALDEAVRIVGYDELRAEQARRRRDGEGVALGIGVSCFCEISGSGPEYGAVRINPDGTAVVASGSSPHGQGHETTFAQIAASVLRLPLDGVTVVHSDTAIVARGTGTFGSRSGQLAGSAVFNAATEVYGRARELVADHLEAAAQDVRLTLGGRWEVAGVPAKSLGWADVAHLASLSGDDLAAEHDFAQESGTFPFGAHIAVVDVDTDTGEVRLRRLVAVDDCGTVVNPLIVAGQVHGGLAQGVAQALFEAVAHDTAGNPLTTNLADYLMPSAADLPSWDLGETVTPSPRNPLGMKGIGESGTVGSTAAVQNAVLDALRPLGVRHVDLPLSPERLWRSIRAAAGRSGQRAAQ